MKNIIIIVLFFIAFNLNAQVKTVPTKFDPIVELNLPGTTIIGSPSIVGKEVTITDTDDATNMTIIIRTPSSDSSSSPTYPNLLTLGSVFKVNIQNVTSGDTVFIREDGLGVNGRIGSPGYPITKNTKLEFVYTTVGWVERKDYAETETFLTSFGEIKNRSFSSGDVIKVRYGLGEATYVVSNDSTTNIIVNSSNAVLSTANGKYAKLQPKNGYIDVVDFGAIPNDIVEDDTEINAAIQYSMYANFFKVGHSKNGNYITDDPVFLIYQKDFDGEFDFFSFELIGTIPNYGVSGNTDGVVYDHNNSNLPCIIIQKARHVTIKNISLLGGLPSVSEAELVTQRIPSDRTTFRTSRYSPHAGICVDPFDDVVGVSFGQRYPGLESWYTPTSDGGSSHINVEGGAIRGFVVGFMHNPSRDIQNGDNVKFFNATIERCFSGFATGQGQSKGNVFRDIYSPGNINILIDCTNFGRGEGAPPFVSDCNIAGSIGRVVEAQTINTSFLHIRSTFMESVHEIGSSSINTLIENCRFSLMQHESRNVPGQNYIWKQTTNQAVFKSCDIVYYSNGTYQYPLNFIEQSTGKIKLEDCYFDSGEILGTLFNSPIGTSTQHYISDLTIEDCQRRTASSTISMNKPSRSFDENLSISNDYSYDLVRYGLSSPMPTTSNPNTSPTITINISSAQSKIVVGDILVMRASGPQTGYGMLLGQAKTVNASNVIIRGVPWSYMDQRAISDTLNIYVLRAKKSMDRVFGDLTNNNDTIKNVYNIDAISVGDYITTPSGNLPDVSGSRTRVIEKGDTWIRTYLDAQGTETKALLYSKDYKKKRTSDDSGNRINNQSYLKAWYVGDEMILTNKDTSILVCTKSGVYGTDWEPEFSPIVSQSYADLNLLEYTAGLIDGGKFSPALTLDSSLIMKSDNGLIRFEEEGGTPIGSFGASRPGNFGFLQWSEWFGILKGSIHQGPSDFQDTTTFNNTSDPNAKVIFNIEAQMEDGVNLVREQDTEFKVSFGRDKGEETNVDFDLIATLRGDHHNLEYFSKITDAATSNNVITLTDVGDDVPHMINFFISAEDDDDLYDVELVTNGDSLIIRDTTISSYILQDNQTVHVKSVVLGGNRYYKIINPEKKGTYTNSSGSNQTVITITHNLGVTPNIVYITPTTDVGTWYVSNKNTTEVEITMSTGLANTASVQWFVDR